MDEGTSVSGIDVLSNDSDVDGDTLSIVSASALNGTVVIDPDDTLSYTPDAGYHGEETITYEVDDGHGGLKRVSFTIDVTPIAAVIPPDLTPRPGGPVDDTPVPDKEEEPTQRPSDEDLAKETVSVVTIDAPTHSGEIVFIQPDQDSGYPKPIDLESLEEILSSIEVPTFKMTTLQSSDSHTTRPVDVLKPIDLASLSSDVLAETISSDAFRSSMEKMHQEIDETFKEKEHKEDLVFKVATGFEVSLTAGFVAWMLRTGSLAASFFSVMPMWRDFDPVPILSESEEEETLLDGTHTQEDEASSQQSRDAEELFDEER